MIMEIKPEPVVAVACVCAIVFFSSIILGPICIVWISWNDRFLNIKR